MANIVKHYNSSWIDITDYVVSGVDKIPSSMMNEDFTLKAESFTIEVAVTVRDHASYADDFEFAAGELVQFLMEDTSFIIGGIIESSVFSYEDQIFIIRVRPEVKALEDYKVDYNTLNTEIASGANWYEYDSSDALYATPVVGVLWLMKCLFSVAGYTLDVDDVKDSVILNRTEWSLDITYQDLITYPVILWCINQSVACSHDTIDDTDEDYRRNKISFFTLLSELLSSLSLVLVQTAPGEFKLIEETSNYTVADDDKFVYEKESLKGDVSIDVAGIRNQVNWTNVMANYGSATPTNIEAVSIGEGDQIDYMMNLVIMYTNAKTLDNKYSDSYSFQECFAWASTDLIITILTNIWLNTAQKRVRALVSNSTKEKILTNFESDKNSVMNHNIDMEWTNSEIVQETY